MRMRWRIRLKMRRRCGLGIGVDAQFARDVETLLGDDFRRVEDEAMTIGGSARTWGIRCRTEVGVMVEGRWGRWWEDGGRAARAGDDDHVSDRAAAAVAAERLGEAVACPGGVRVGGSLGRCGRAWEGGREGRAVGGEGVGGVERDGGAEEEDGLETALDGFSGNAESAPSWPCS